MVARPTHFTMLAAVLNLICCLIGPDVLASETRCPLQAGTYLSRTYIDILRKTRSPFKADIQTVKQNNVATVWHRPTRCEITPETFHEGGLIYVVKSNRILTPTAKSYPAPTHFRVVTHESFELAFDKTNPIVYEYVKNLEAFVASIALAGRYVDTNGRIYAFHSDGTARFPDRQFKFTVGLDHVLTRFDYFIETGTISATIPYRREGTSLLLFTTKKQENQDVEEIDTTKPPVELKRLSDS